jgi:hypothetical protein
VYFLSTVSKVGGEGRFVAAADVLFARVFFCDYARIFFSLHLYSLSARAPLSLFLFRPFVPYCNRE